MLEVFVFGVFVAYVKLGDLVTIGLAAGVYALLALTFVLIWMDSALDREAVWERLYHGNLRGGPPRLPPAVRRRPCGPGSTPRPPDPRPPPRASHPHPPHPSPLARPRGLPLCAARPH